MINNLFNIIWQNIFDIFLQITDAFYRVFVRLLYHSKVVGVLTLFCGVVFVTSSSLFFPVFFAIYYDGQNNLNNFDNKGNQNINNLQNQKSGGQGFYAIDVGQGDSLLYITKNNQTFLIDTGSTGDGIVQKLEKILGKFRKKIDVVLLTHPDSDHAGEINDILSSYNVGLLLYSPIYESRPNSIKSIEEIKNKTKGVTLVLPVFAGENLSFSSSEKTYFLSPAYSGMETFIGKKEITEDNYYSVVSMIKNKDVTFAMADAPQKIEKVLASYQPTHLSMSGSLSGDVLGRSSSTSNFNIFNQVKNLTGESFSRDQFNKIILKVGHHGSKNSSAPKFIQKLLPTDAVFSYGENNKYGHPNKEVLDFFAEYSPETKIHRTISGTVYFGE